MTGTILNAVGILLGGIAGMTSKKPLSPRAQQGLKVGLGVATMVVGLRLTWVSLGSGFSPVWKQLVIVVLAMMLGRLTGHLLRLQKLSNRLGQVARNKMAASGTAQGRPSSDGFITGTVLFCVGPLAVLGAFQDGLSGQWQALAIKAAMDGLTMMAFIPTFGRGVMLSVVPVVAYQGTLTLGAKWLGMHLAPLLLDAMNATGGLLVFSVALVMLEIKRVELADYLPSLAFAPLLAWLLR